MEYVNKNLSKKEVCHCCPYGYHIDVDFVRFCETFSKSDIDKESHSRHSDSKKKPFQTMGSLLGLKYDDKKFTNKKPFKYTEEQIESDPLLSGYELKILQVIKDQSVHGNNLTNNLLQRNDPNKNDRGNLPEKTVEKKDVVVNCAVATRDIEVAHGLPKVRHVSTNTISPITRSIEVNTTAAADRSVHSRVTVSTQTTLSAPVQMLQASTQSEKLSYINCATMVKPNMYDASVSVKPILRDVGSECNNLSHNDEKYFYYGDISLSRMDEASNSVIPNRYTQYQPNSKKFYSKYTNTVDDVKLQLKQCSTQTSSDLKWNNCKTAETNTEIKKFVDKCTGNVKCLGAVIDKSTYKLDKKRQKPIHGNVRNENSQSNSKIPKFQKQTSPVLRGRLTRQDTYTVPPEEESGCTFVLPVIVPRSPRPFENHSKSEISDSDMSDLNSSFSSIRTSVENSPYFRPISHSPITKDQNENFKDALTVLNSFLHNPTELPESHDKIATSIVKEKWFKISSVRNADFHLVRYYLDVFENISTLLLKYIVNMCDGAGNTAMHYAVSHGNFNIIATLLDTKVCDVNIINDAGYTCIMLVSLAEIKSNVDLNVIRRLVKMSNINMKSKKCGQTTLMLAVISHRKLDIINLLLECGADINIRDDDGNTALMCAAEHGYLDIVRLLCLQPQCDLTLEDNNGNTALTIAMEAGNREIAMTLYAKQYLTGTASGRNYFRKSNTSTTKNRTPSNTSSPNFKFFGDNFGSYSSELLSEPHDVT